jgi:hypothetical protein
MRWVGAPFHRALGSTAGSVRGTLRVGGSDEGRTNRSRMDLGRADPPVRRLRLRWPVARVAEVGVEPTTFTEMLVHLGTVHLPLCLGVLSVLITTGWAFVERRSGSPIAFAGALLSTAAEAWHASIHLRLNMRGGPIAEGVAMIGFVVVVIAVWIGGRQERWLAVPRKAGRAA